MDNDEEAVVTGPRRPSVAKMPIRIVSHADADSDAGSDSSADPAVFHRLPDEIIEQILFATDPSGFASLILLNSKWRATSQRPHLYAHHLARCPSYATSHASRVPPADDEHLPLLRRLFAHEVKRNLLDAYLRPRQTLIKLVSNSISSSSCPGGEGMQFGFSPRGRRVLAYNSSRIYLIHLGNHPVRVEREFRIRRRPVSACVTDDARTLAVLSTELQVDVYDLGRSPPVRKRSLVLDNSSQAVAMSSCGTVIAAAHDGGIDISSLAASALPAEKRAVKCDAVDMLTFSQDGTHILGSTVHSSPPSTVVLTAPYYDPGSQAMGDDSLGAMWTTSLLFPNTSRDCSHAILLPTGDGGGPEWTFTYDRSFETFRAVRLDDLRNGTTYFTGPVPKAASQTKLLPCSPPAATAQGDLVSAGFQGNEIWVYGVPEDLAAIPEPPPPPPPPPVSRDSSMQFCSLGRHNSTQSSASRHAPETERVPQWQILCDKVRNNLVAGLKVLEMDGVSSVRWVDRFGSSSCQERLVVTATGVTGGWLAATDEEDVEFMDGGRIALLDFDYAVQDGGVAEFRLEVGTDDAEPLTEERRDLEADVAIVRRRTVAQKRGGGVGGGGDDGFNGILSRIDNAVLEAATTSAKTHLPALPSGDDGESDPLAPRIVGQHPARRADLPARPPAADDDELASMEQQEAMDAPYTHSSPRSQTTLRRAATAAAVNRHLNPRTADGRPIAYRRADGRTEHPHESDADGWVPPPPPYQEEDPGDLPVFLRSSFAAPAQSATVFPPTDLGRPMSGVPAEEEDMALAPKSAAPGGERPGGQNRWAEFTMSSDGSRPRYAPSVHSVDMDDDIYDASPQASPQIMPFSMPVGEDASDFRTVSPLLSLDDIAFADGVATASPAGASAPAPASSSVPAPAPAPAPRDLGLHARSGSRPAIPTLGLDIPTTPLPAQPAVPRLSNAQTWPRQPRSASLAVDATRPAPHLEAYALTAPPFHMTSDDATAAAAAAAAFFPAPSPTQVASLNERISRGVPRRLSGSILSSRLWKDQGRAPASAGPSCQRQQQQQQPFQTRSSRPLSEARASDPDRPLIISTPSGLSGSNDDAPPPRRTEDQAEETPILSPIPRRPPRANSSSAGGTAQRLEENMCTASVPPSATTSLVPHLRLTALPMWMRTPSSSSPKRTPSGVGRRRSRAERSAAKNMQDARLRGWKMKSRGKHKKNNGVSGEQQQPAGDGSGWVDVPSPRQPRSGRCVVM